MLIGIAIFFGVIELIALFIGVRLTRSMTKSVAELYTATQTRQSRRPDASHPGAHQRPDGCAGAVVQLHDASLSKLIAEQKEKQRLEGELAIAHEVQTLLFPRRSQRPALAGGARRVPPGAHRERRLLRLHSSAATSELMLAVGDISGKGISAALLMATVHAFVRAYSLEPERTLASVAIGAPVSGWQRTCRCTAGSDGNGDSALARDADGDPELPALSQHAAGEVRDHVPRLLRRRIARR